MNSRIENLVENCAYGPQMATHAIMLAGELSLHDGDAAARARQKMASVDLRGRMARRATEVANYSLKGASRLVQAMQILFGAQATLDALNGAGYLTTQHSRALRHRKGGNRHRATTVEAHIEELRNLLHQPDGHQDRSPVTSINFGMVKVIPTPVH